MNLHADVLIVTATKIESKAIFEVFRSISGHAPEPIAIGDRMYHNLGSINDANVFLVQSEMGTGGLGASLMTVQKGIVALAPSAVIMAGIAFGTDAEKQSIGDILVSQQLMLYELQRVSTKEGELILTLRGDRPHASPKLVDRFRSADIYWEETKPKVRFGPILSGEKLVDNIDFREQLRKFASEAIGGEMEGAGLYVACQDAKVDWILVKSICDWADGNKAHNKEEQQKLAATNAASFVLHVLQHAPLKSERVRSESNYPISSDNKNDMTQVTVILDKEIHKFTSDEQASFIFALSRIVNVAPDQIRILQVVQGSVILTVEMPKEAAKFLLSLMQHPSKLHSLQIIKVELKHTAEITLTDQQKPVPKKLYKLQQYIDTIQESISQLPLDLIEEVINTLHDARLIGKQVFIMGNGGSALIASHFGIDLAKNTRKEGWPHFKVIDLANNVGIITAYANDEGYDNVFAQQLASLICTGDIVIGISASGNSPNVLKAMEVARQHRATSIGFTGFDGGKLAKMVDINIHIPSLSYSQVEVIHQMLGKMIVDALKVRVLTVSMP